MNIMNTRDAEKLAQKLLAGECTVEDFVADLSRPVTADLGMAQVDLDRHRRCGFPEVVFGEGKSAEAIEQIFRALLDDGVAPLATRVSADKAEKLSKAFSAAYYNPLARTFRVHRDVAETKEPSPGQGAVTVVTAGTSDLPVAEEARETALWMGDQVDFIQDVGVAGPHRLPAHLDRLEKADAVVVVAGMEGALPSVVGGYVACPVIAVPTSVGYGASFGGIAALLGMLNSCASNVTVVNIDSGFKGGYVAALIAKNAARHRATS
jgi:hypothetical protein